MNDQFSEIIQDSELLAQAIRNSVTGVSIADMRREDFPLIFINPAFEKLTGYSPSETIGKNCRFLQGVERDQPALEIIRQSLKEGKECKVVLKNFKKDGTMFWNELSMSPVHNDKGELTHFIAIQHDVTKEIEAHQKSEELNRKLQIRTEQLELMLKELETFSYSVSHDLRAPLRHISGYADLLRQHTSGELDQKGERYLNIILDASKKMGVLIDDLLTFSRIGRAEIQTSMVDTRKIVEQNLEIFKDANKDRSIEFKIGALPEVQVDVSMYSTVFQNLLSNAIKYTGKKDHAVVEVNCETKDQFYIFSVKDNGAGFDPRYQHKLFGIFQRLHREDEFEGTGIGLANAKRVVLRHGGEIWAESEQGKGATFYFSIPKTPRII